MSLKPADKNKVLIYLNKTPLSSLAFSGMTENLGRTKYTYIDFLDFFISTIKNNLVKEKIPINITKKMVSCSKTLVEWCHREKISIDDTLIDRINELAKIYQDAIDRNLDLEDKDLLEFLTDLLGVTSDLPEENKEASALAQLENKIERLTKKIASLEATITEKDTKLKRNQTTMDELSANNRSKNFTIKEHLQSIHQLETELEALNNELEGLRKKNKELEISSEEKEKELQEVRRKLETIKTRLRKCHEDNERLNRKISELSSKVEYEQERSAGLKQELASYQLELRTIRETEEQQRREQIRNQEIEQIILSYLCRQTYSSKTLINALLKRGYDITGKELYERIRALRTTVNIESSMYSLGEPKYHIEKPAFKSGMRFPMQLPKDEEVVDIVFASDFHIDELTPKFLDNYRWFLDYCERNKIKLIFNLGDFFDFTQQERYVRSLDALKRMQDKTQRCIENLPESPIYHAVLGGNHDKSISYLGQDYLTQFIDARQDFLALGFDWAKLILKESGDTQIKFLLAHPSTSVSKTTRNLYGETFSDFDFSFLGHSHSYCLSQKYCKVASFSIDRIENGFLHVRLHFNENRLDNIKLKPVSLERKIKPRK